MRASRATLPTPRLDPALAQLALREPHAGTHPDKTIATPPRARSRTCAFADYLREAGAMSLPAAAVFSDDGEPHHDEQ
jgi:hypothetical protein